MAQHPFTPEPREPEPWPERDITPWEWAGNEGQGHEHDLHYMVLVEFTKADLARWRTAVKKDRDKRLPPGEFGFQ